MKESGSFPSHDGEPSRRVWAYRKAAWAIEDTPQDLGLIYRSMGRKGLESIRNVGPMMAQVVEALLTSSGGNPTASLR